MKRRKQFVALSLAAVLVFGSISPISSVYAEELQTETSTELSVEPGTEPSTEQVTEPQTESATEPSTEQVTEVSTEQPTVPATEPTSEQTTVPTTEPTTAVSAEQPTAPSVPQSVADESKPDALSNAESVQMPVFTDSNVNMETATVGILGIKSLEEKVQADALKAISDDVLSALKIESVKEDTNYGNDAIEISFMGKTSFEGDYNKGSGRTIPKNGTTYWYSAKAGSNSTTTWNGDQITTNSAIKVVANKTGTISFTLYKTSGAVHFDSYQDGAVKNPNGYPMVLSDHAVCTFDVVEGNTYYLWVDGGKFQAYNITYTYPGKPPIEFPTDKRPAFPGAEGGGMYATGGRGGDVYVVTNLNDDGEGSLRYGINSAPAAGRTIVFDVGGTINLKSTLTFKQKQNITIAGQTAPGDGITIAGYDTNLSDSRNIIIRFVRFRVGSDNLFVKGADSMDALWGRDNDTFMIDHCTFSWNTDETLSTYRGRNGTVQWCIISESLTVSGHSKGRHGYGGIFGGDNTVFQYNLITNHTSRNPRIGGGSMTDPIADAKDPSKTPSTATLQLSNNVLYNHGFYPCYGGGYAYTNYINNIVKPGKGTRESLRNTLIHVGEKGKFGGFYVDGNILVGNDAVTANNAAGIREDAPNYISNTAYTTSDTTKFDFDAFASIHPVSAQACYDLVLNSAGATFPYRDAIDARVVEQVKNDTGFYINRPEEVGGYPARTVTAADENRVDTDHDGIPDAWEIAHSLNPGDASDSVKPFTGDTTSPNYGYSALEVYCNDLVKDVVVSGYKAENPTVTIDLPNNAMKNVGEGVTVTATAAAQGGATIAKVEFYNGLQLVGTVNTAPYTYTYPGLEDGTYNISVRAYDSVGRATQSDTSKLHINSTAGTGDWLSADVGNPALKGTASLTDGVLTVKSAGKLGKSEGSVAGSALNNAATDDFHFVYQQMKGDVELVTKLDSFTAVDCHTFNGIMFRESLDKDAATAALGLTMTKIWDGYDTVWTAFMAKRETKGGAMTDISETIDGKSAAENAGIPAITDLNFKTNDTFNGTWLKLTRKGNVFTGSVSNDGLVWQEVGKVTVELPETVYVGFAVDAGKAANELENYSTAKFSNFATHSEFGTITYKMENVTYQGANQFAAGEDVAITLSSIKGYLLPETVTVTVDGKEIAADYDRERGIISLRNLSGNVVITAQGVKRQVVMVNYEEVDPQNLLTVEEKNGKLILTQSAGSGSTSTGFPGDASYKAAVNESWILFPEVTQLHDMTMKITVKQLLPVGGNDNTGVFIGVFDVNENRNAFDSLAFRPCTKTAEAVSKFWTKGDKTGNGGTKQAIVMDTVYTVTFSHDATGQFTVEWQPEGGAKVKETFKVSENYFKKGAAVRYGIGLIGATAEVTDLTYTDWEGNVIYTQDSADYSAVDAAIEKASKLDPNEYMNFDIVRKAWDAVVYGLPATEQAKVDAMAKDIEDAITKLVKGTPIKPIDPANPESFVDRLYTLVLGRDPDEKGHEEWTNSLIEQRSSGVDIGYGFVFSQECKERKLSNEEFVEMLYNTYLGRPSDEGGKAAWVSQLDAGVDREKVFEGFAMSDEFSEICTVSGINRGSISDVPQLAAQVSAYRNQNANLTKFVAGCYEHAFDRTYDLNGLEDWCRTIINGVNTPKQAAQSFIFSDEFTEKKLSDEEYVTTLYHVFLHREPDAEGLAAWVKVLESGKEDRAKVLDGFADSVEFDSILESYNLK